MAHLQLNNLNASGLKEYNPPENLFEQYKIAKQNKNIARMKQLYEEISIAAENGDQDAFITLALIYNENPVAYGKKRNRLFQYVDLGASNRNLGIIYMYGKSVTQDKDKAFDYWERAIAQGDTKIYQILSIYEYQNDNMKRAWYYARRYLERNEKDLNLENLRDALVFVMGERSRILDLHQKPDMSYIEKNVSKLLELYKMPYIEGEERNQYYDYIAEEAVLLHAEGLIEHERYKEAVEVLLSDTIGGYREIYKLFKIKKHLDITTYMNTVLTFWKRANDLHFSEEYRKQVMTGIEFVIHRFKARSFFEYHHFVSLGQAAGCKNAESFMQDIQNTLHENALLQQAKDVLQTSNFELAIKEIERLAEKGNKDACFELAKIYEQGIKRPRDMKKAESYYEKAGRKS